MESPTGRLNEEFKNLLKEISKVKYEESFNINQSILKRISCFIQCWKKKVQYFKISYLLML